MKNSFQIEEKQLKQQCTSEYLEQMKWTYDGGIGASTLRELNPNQFDKTIYISTAHAHIDYAFKSLKPLYLFWLDQNGESKASTDLQNFELENLSYFCALGQIDYQQVIEFMETDAQRFLEDNFKKGESYSDFESRVIDLNFKDRSLWWKEGLKNKWYIFSTSSDRKTTRIINSNSTRNIKRKESTSLIEKVNWDKIKRPEEMTVLNKSKNKKQNKAVSKKSDKVIKKQNKVVSLSDERSKRFFNYLKGEIGTKEFDSTELLTTAFKGWSWMCETHRCYGIGEDEDEVLFMAGSHMYFVENRGIDCEIFTREFL